MKMSPTFRYRPFVFAGMLFAALAFGTVDQLFLGARLQAQTNVPASARAPAPTAASIGNDTDVDKPVVTLPSGLKYVDLVVGTGAMVKTGDHLVLNYEGRLLDGTKFDSSYDRGQLYDFVLGVSHAIPGWSQGLATMKVGGTRKLLVPPQLGYGLDGNDVIPPNATLIYKIELVAVKPN